MRKPTQPGIGPQPVAESEIHCENEKVFETDAGKKVLVNTIGGALKNWKGIVIEGPFKLTFIAKKSKGFVQEGFVKKPKLVDTMFLTDPYWLVKLDANGFYLYFSEKELTFLED